MCDQRTLLMINIFSLSRTVSSDEPEQLHQHKKSFLIIETYYIVMCALQVAHLCDIVLCKICYRVVIVRYLKAQCVSLGGYVNKHRWPQ